MNLRIILTAWLVTFATLSLADDRQPPASWSLDQMALTPLNQLQSEAWPALDLEGIAFEDSLRQSMGEPPRFAIPQETVINIHDHGSWDVVGDTSVWRFRFQAEDAALINLGMHNVFLPDSARLYFYTSEIAAERRMDRYQVAGPYDASINRDHGEFWTPNLHADDVIVELNVATDQREAARMEINQLSQGYRGFGAAASEYQQPELADQGEGKQSCLNEDGSRSGACNLDVACLSEDDPWNEPRRSVGAYSRGGVFACSGSLVNNTANDQRMLFITATHCMNAGHASSVRVYWNYEWPSCRRPGASGGTSVNPPDPNMSSYGSTFLSATSNPFQGQCTASDECSDITLIELDDAPDPDWNLYWSGWDRRPPPTACSQGAPNTTEGLCAGIHHPGVHEKRITFVEQDIQAGNIAGATNIHWWPYWHPNPPELPNIPDGSGNLPIAVTEGGSSGSPLYTAEQRFIGVLSGGQAACGNPAHLQYDMYGQLAHGWEGMGTPSTRVREHLDPLGTAPLTLNGIGSAGFAIEPEVHQISHCGFDDLDVAIDISETGGFSEPVTLSTDDLPAGVSDSYSSNNQIPPFSTVLTLGNLAAAGQGDHVFTVIGDAGGQQESAAITLSLLADDPRSPELIAPLDGATDQPVQPELSWDALYAASSYQVQIATDADFNALIVDETVAETEFIPAIDLASGTHYYWRVRAQDSCGDSDWSDTRQFQVRFHPQAEISPTSLSFDLPQNSTQTVSLEISNIGDGELNWSLSPASCAGSSPTAWLSVDPESGSLSEGQSFEALVTADATDRDAGEYSALMCLASNDGDRPQITIAVQMTVEQLPPGEFVLDPVGTLAFADTALGSARLESITLSNVAAEGSAAVELGQIQLVTGQANYSITANDCDSGLAPQQSCTLAVRFAPESLGFQLGVLRIPVDGDSFNISLTGSGVEPEPIIFEDRFED